MRDAQKWIEKKYPTKVRNQVKEIIKVGWSDLENHLYLKDFYNLEKLDIQNGEWWNYENKLKKNKITDLNIRSLHELVDLRCGGNEIKKLDLKDNENLIFLDCSNNELSDLDLSYCPNLRELYCHDNKLSSINFLKNLPNPKNLTHLNISGNNFACLDLSFLSEFTGLKKLSIGNNRFSGSLKYLKIMNKLEELNISDTDIDSGLECLPNILKEIRCEVKKRPEARCIIIKKSLKECYDTRKRIYEYWKWTPSSKIKKLNQEPVEEEKIFYSINKFLVAKKDFLTTRQNTIEKLRNVYNKLVNSTNKKHANIDSFGNVLNDIGGAPVTLGIPKVVGGIVKMGNGFFRQKSSDEGGQHFFNLLEEEEEKLPQFNSVYNSLINLVRLNPELKSSEIVNSLNLVERLDLEESRLFSIKYKVFDIDKGIWEGKPLTAEEMKVVIISLGKNLDELRVELEQEERQVKRLRKEQFQTQTEAPLQYSK